VSVPTDVVVLGVTFGEKAITIEWTSEEDQRPEGSTYHQTSITQEGEEAWEHVSYYAEELRQDAEELILWFEKYRAGRV